MLQYVEFIIFFNKSKRRLLISTRIIKKDLKSIQRNKSQGNQNKRKLAYAQTNKWAPPPHMKI